jgi:TonB-dependent starch-binding outer membrane protein SusC
MKKLILYLFTVCVGLLQTISAQTVTGTVTGADDGQPLPGVNIMIKGTAQGAITDLNGQYNIDVTGIEGATLVFSYVGYLAQEVVVGSQTTIDVVLGVDATGIDEVVVVGYGTQKRSEVTGAITSVDTEQLTALPATTADEALQGRAAGVTVINNGSPGTAPTVRIRGLGTMNANDPLVVIDGIIASGMGDINPSDIASMQILKDASTTAIYGSKGANGVIIITTKKGSSGKIKVDFESYWGQQWNNNRYDLLNAEQYRAYAGSGAAGAVPTAISDPQYTDRINGADTDWQDQIFQKGMMQNYTVGVSGGNENSTFRVSTGYISKEGIMIGTNYKRYNFRANSDYKLFNGKVKVGEALSVSSGLTNPLTSNGGRSLIEHAIKMAPYLPVYNPENLGGYQGPNGTVDANDAENPVRVALLPSYDMKTINISGNVYGEIEIIEGLKFKTLAGIEAIRLNDEQFEPTYNDDNLGATHTLTLSNIRKNRSDYTSKIFTQSLNYKKTFADKHNLELLGVMEYATVDRYFMNTSSRFDLSDAIQQLSSNENSTGSAKDEYRRIGYLGRLNYNFDSKYLIAASIRRDASSRLLNNRWSNFPSVALGWKISNESFMENVAAISNLKLRGSWGKAGNDLIGNYRYSTTLSPNYYYVIDDEAVVGVGQTDPANKNLKWETTTMTNIGLDLGLLEDQFTLSFEYYKNNSDDLLLDVPLPPSLGGGFLTQNLGEVETKGWELQLGYNDFEGDFQWSASLNLGAFTNEVIKLGVESLNGGGFENENLTRLTEGESLFYFYGWQFDGIFPNDAVASAYLGGGQAGAGGGDYRIVDTNGDGVINADDRTKIGNPFPDFTAGLNLNASYKGLDFSLFIQGSYGNDIYNTNIFDLEGMNRVFNASTAVLDRWTTDLPDNASPSMPRGSGDGGAPTNVQASTRYIEDGSYTRLKNITLGYTLPSSLLDRVKLSKVRVYVSAQNLVTLTNYSGLDPEVGYYQARGTGTGFIGSQATTSGAPTVNFNTGIDYGVYPMPKSFIAGLQISF